VLYKREGQNTFLKSILFIYISSILFFLPPSSISYLPQVA